jgi:Tol biopolymer transport system component
MLLIARAAAAPGDLVLASTSAAGAKGNQDSMQPSLSANGTVVAFDSFATNLHAGDTLDDGDVYVKQLATGGLTLASTDDDGTKGDNSSANASLAGDGSAVAFDSSATNLDPADDDTLADVYVKDLASGGLTLASTSAGGDKGDGSSLSPSLSGTGTFVAFSSASTNLVPADTDATVDIFVKELATGAVTLVSTDDLGTKGNGDSSEASISADGTRVAFTSTSTNLDPADPDGDADVYVKDLLTGDIELASITIAGSKGVGADSTPSLSADGSAVAFSSFSENLDPADTDLAEDVYVKDLDTGSLVLASTSDEGTKGDAGSGAASLSGDGSKVAFHSVATNLDPDHTEAGSDVYVKDLTTMDLALVSSPESVRPSLSANGASVAFESTSTILDPGDTDPFVDIYVRELDAGPIEADLGVTIADSPDPVASGQLFTYTVTVTNAGGSDATGVTLTDVIDDVKLRSVVTSHGACVEDARADTVTCDLGSLSNGASATVEIVVRAVRPKQSPITNTATVSASEPDPDTSDNEAVAETAIGGG